MNEERRLSVLRAIVEDYVETNEPVGSKALLDRHRLGVSAATIRNDMAALEEDGLIAAPHTSAGRVPTDAGYRMFVDRLSAIKPMTVAERRAISQFLDGAVDLDDVVERTVRLLSSLTRQVAVMQYPSLTRSSVRHVELVPVAASRLLVVLITTSGRVEQRLMATPVDLTDATRIEVLARLRSEVNEAAVGRPLAEASAALAALAADPERVARVGRDVGALIEDLTRTLDGALVEEREERVVLAGKAHLARSGADLTALGEVLEALEEHVVLLKLLRSHDIEGHTVAVRIGHENPFAGLHSTSMVTTGYGLGANHVAGLGVLGPTRMDYPTSIAAVRAVATYVSRILAL